MGLWLPTLPLILLLPLRQVDVSDELQHAELIGDAFRIRQCIVNLAVKALPAAVCKFQHSLSQGGTHTLPHTHREQCSLWFRV